MDAQPGRHGQYPGDAGFNGGANLYYWGEARANWTFNATGNVAANNMLTWTTVGGAAAPPNTAPNPNSWATNTPATLMPEAYGGLTANLLYNRGAFNAP